MYEKLLSSFNTSEKAGQILLAHLIIELDRSQVYTAENCIPVLAEMGFMLETFGESSYLVKEIPYFLSFEEAERFLYEFFDSAGDFKNNLQLRRDAIISKSCKSAVKAHDRMSLDEMKGLLSELDKCENPYSCPHGRPTFIKFSEYELEKMFKRK
jgi:DNA mismatch repair protein MutL